MSLELTRHEAFSALAAVHDARLELKALNKPSLSAMLEALEAHERDLGIAIGTDSARAFLKRRARRHSQTPAAKAPDADPTASGT